MTQIKSDRHLKVKDFLVSGESFYLLPCRGGDMLETYPKPTEENLLGYYESEEYISHTDNNSGVFSRLYQLVKKWSLRKKVVLIKEQNAGVGTLLDVGAGTGDFLKVAMGNGWMVSGIEPNKKARILASDKGVSLRQNLNDFEGKKFDVITLWHVLEHIPNLKETISKLNDMVHAGGTLIIAVPNFRSYDAEFYGEHWAAYDVPRHLWHFSEAAIQKLFEDNFVLEKTEPMIFDSFYVSLLSEKYKNGKHISIKAFYVGLKSNLLAKTTKEYSSHIYCLRKIK